MEIGNRPKISKISILKPPINFTLIMITVTRIVMTFKINVKSRYFAIKGILEEVGGRIFDTSNKKTTMDSKTLIVN